MDGGRSGNYGRGGGRGYHRAQASGGRGPHNQPRPQQQWGERSEHPHQQGAGRGPHHHQPRPQQQWAEPAEHPHQQGWGRGPHHQPRPQQQWAERAENPPQQGVGRGAGGGRTGGGRPWGQPRTPSSFPVQSPAHPPTPRATSDELDTRSCTISPPQPLSPPSLLSKGDENGIQPIRRPDQGGRQSVRLIKLLVNHFPVKFGPRSTIFHYDVDVKPVTSNDNQSVKRTVRKSDFRLIRDKLCFDNPDTFPILKTAYDGEKNIFSAVSLPSGQYMVELSDGENTRGRSYLFTIKFVNELKLCKLSEYLRGELSYIPRDVLQGMDLVMKENPARQRNCVGGVYYSSDYRREDDLQNGVAAYRGFRQSLKPTAQGLSLCLDYSVLAFRKPMSVIDYLKENVPPIKSIEDIKRFRSVVIKALKGLKVRVTHRPCKQKYPIVGLAEKDTCNSWFDLVDREGNNPPRKTSLVTYFQEKWGRNIENPNIPCLQLGRSNKSPDEVPLEFCVLVEGQRYPKEHLDYDRAKYLKDLSVAKPGIRQRAINEMLQANDGPCGVLISNFGIQVDKNMTKVGGRVIGAPELRIGGSRSVKVDGEKCQWNLTGDRCLVDGKAVARWALIDFTDGERYNRLQKEMFIGNLKSRCGKLGIRMDDPLVCHLAPMRRFSSVEGLENLLKDVVDKARSKSKENLQIIVCVMANKDPGYKFLKWVSETKIGVLTQCCLSSQANKGQDQYLANLCLKINAKLGGSNFELMAKLPHFVVEDHVMFIGADVNHPAPNNESCPSIAAVVGTVNWPAANRYAARVSPQTHRAEKIANFGGMCLDLINTYTRLNGAKPNKIVIFRDGVSEGQFLMVLAEELRDIKNTIYEDHYRPTITLIVAQKRHQTRLFGEGRNDMGLTGNVPPGTVVDTVIVHPSYFDFYLCSHYGGLGTSKPTHYHVLYDENLFTSDQLQKLIYDMCFTFARCTKPVSLVPPVYYADLVAYRGRLFQEAAMESHSRFSPSSSHASSNAMSSTSSSTAWCDNGLYNLHPELENIMFFV
ncbi:protein argonaute 2-like [Henckelia pumila]|uniref:protein argonaute 2-like n=1 Tax=Henckelia pumila TaxID=405737 RepID=UPI003C6E94C7